jgi:uncharacterized protein YhdP
MASLTQLASSFRNTGLAFNSLSGDLTLDGGYLSSEKLHIKGGSLALMGGGSADLGNQTVDLHGTVIPFSNVNNIVGLIPVLGTAVVGSDRKGFMAVEYTIKGKFDSPQVEVKKQAATPKLLRNILGTDQVPDKPQ